MDSDQPLYFREDEEKRVRVMSSAKEADDDVCLSASPIPAVTGGGRYEVSLEQSSQTRDIEGESI
jgi:hypothetical protein